MAMFDRFNQSAINIIEEAKNISQTMNHSYIGTEHLILAILKSKGIMASDVLNKHGVTYENMEKIVSEIVIIDESDQFAGFTPRVKRIFENSIQASRNLGNTYVGAEHILLSILLEEDCIASIIIKDMMGVDIKMLRSDIVGGLADGSSDMDFDDMDGFSGGPAEGQSNVEKFGRDLTEMAKNSKLDPVIGRENEIDRVIQILSRRTKNNPVLIGEPGVGKTAIAEGLAQKIVSGDVPEILKNKKVVTLDLASMLAGSKYRGEFEERLKGMMEEIIEDENTILFIDEIHTIVGAGASEGSVDASNILKPALARGELQTIGATTIDEYRKYIEKDAALERRFQPVNVPEPTEEDSIKILQGLRDKYEAHHEVKIPEEAIEAAVELSVRYITDRYLPDKAIDLIDEASSKVRLRFATQPKGMLELETELERLSKEKQEAINTQNFEKAATLRD